MRVCFYIFVGSLGRRLYEWADRRLERWYSGSVIDHVRAAKWEGHG